MRHVTASIDEADRRYAVIAETGQTVPWSEMRRYLKRRVADEPLNYPRPEPCRSKIVARIEVAPEVAGDLDRIVDHLIQHEVAHR
jgi:hypothetical protein